MMKQLGYARMKIERRARWDCHWRPVDIILRQIETVYWHLRRFTVIECFGDSHVKVFRRLNWMYPKLRVRFRTVSVMGATAYGVVNYNSATSAREIYEKRLNSLQMNHKVLVMLGEIDTGFLIWSLAKKKSLLVENVLEETIERYGKFLTYINKMDKDIIVCSAPLPTIDDEVKKPDYLLAREGVKVSKKKRTDLALKFNTLVQEFCRINNIIYLDLDLDSIDATTGLLSEKLISSTKLDHHYNEAVYAKLLKNKLISMGVIEKGVNL